VSEKGGGVAQLVERPLWSPSLTKDMQREQLLCWSVMTDTEPTTSSLNEDVRKRTAFFGGLAFPNQSELQDSEKLLIGWKKDGHPKMPIAFQSCKPGKWHASFERATRSIFN